MSKTHLQLKRALRAALLVLLLSAVGLSQSLAQPQGALNGLFSVGENTQVYFSQGNLQYQASTNTWRFAENQWDYVGTQIPDENGLVGGTVIGSDNNGISQTYEGWIDLFGWGTSGYDHGAVCYQPWSTWSNLYAYNAYGDPQYNLYDQNGQADWGYNAISNGGNTENSGWHTMTQVEWDYLIYGRNTTSDIRFAKAVVNGINGLVLLPDNWSVSIYSLNNVNNAEYGFNSNTITSDDWTNILEANGAVFLPITGCRVNGNQIWILRGGHYWTSTAIIDGDARSIGFFDDHITVNGNPSRCDGRAVRLVRNAEPQTYGYIDLGLPSGTLWATCNVGADTPEGYGSYFAWGETQPKDTYNWSTYQYCNGSENTLTKYCSNSNYGYNGSTDNLTVLQPEDDAATANWGNDWRMPTQAEWQELYQNTTVIWTTRNGVNGRLYTASNGNSLFLPAAGYRYNSTLEPDYGYYWSSSLDTDTPRGALYLYFLYYDYPVDGGYPRYCGLTIRPVRTVSQNTSFIIDATANPAEGGEVNGGGTYEEGAECTLTAMANEGYTFTNWTENGEVVSTIATYTFSVSADRTLVANFTQNGGDDHEYVDLGLPSGLLWAICNVGADAPEEYGDYFAWGETQPKDYYDWNTYQYCEGSYNTLTKYCNDSNYGNNGYTDTLTVLLPEDDAATANWGDGWRMPTEEEWLELFDNTTSEWTTQNGVDGRLFTATNGNSLFFPAAGSRFNNYPIGANCYWSSSLDTNGPTSAWHLFFSDDDYGRSNSLRICGLPIRPVRASTQYMSSLSDDFNDGVIDPELWTYTGNTVLEEEGLLKLQQNVTDQDVHLRSVDLGIPENRIVNMNRSFLIHRASNYYHGRNIILLNGDWESSIRLEYIYTYHYNDSYQGTPKTGVYLITRLDGVETEVRLCDFSFDTWHTEYVVVDFAAETVSYYLDSFEATVPVPGLAEQTVNYYNVQYAPWGWWTGHYHNMDYVNINTNMDDTFTVTATANPAEGGTVSGGGTYECLTTCTLTATANEDYTFINWMENGQVVSTEPTFSFTVFRDRNLVAHFTLPFAITATAEPAEGGTVEGAGIYNYGETCTLTATANEGYTFMYWAENGNILSYEAEIAFTVLGDRNLVANFMEGNGCVLTIDLYDSYGDGWNGNKLTMSYEGGYEEITLNSGSSGSQILFVPDSAHVTLGWIMGSWTDECSFNVRYANGNVICHGESMSSNFSFEFDMDCVEMPATIYSITAMANPEEGGAVTGYGGYTYGQTCTLTATANEDYTFINWTENGEVVSTENPYTFTVTGDRELVANFVESSTHWTPNNTDYEENMPVTAVVEIDGVEQQSTTLELGAFSGEECRGSQMALYFEPTQRYLYQMTVFGEEGDEIAFRLYDHATNEELELVAPEAITFTTEGFGYGTLPNPIVLNFRHSYDITATANLTEGGNVEGGGTFLHGETCTLTATPNDGYVFVRWTLDGEVVSTEAEYTFEVTGAGEYTAHFNLVQTTNFSQGWNWWSSYVELNGSYGLEALENGLDANGVMIKSQNDGYVSYSEELGWYGSLVELYNEQSYRVKANADCTVQLQGLPTNPANYPVSLNSGWTWMGFPWSQSVSVESALQDFEPEANDLIKGRNAYTMYYNENGYSLWFGPLNSLEPGQGYVYYSNSGEVKTLTFNTNGGRSAQPNVTADDNFFRPEMGNYADNMTLTAVVDLDGGMLRSEDYEVAAFCNGECRGSAKLAYFAPTDSYIAFLTLYGNAGDALEFALTDGTTTMASDDAVRFASDVCLGTLSEPYTLHFGILGVDDAQTSVKVYPNPTQGVFSVEGAGIRRIEVFNAFGQAVYSEETSNETFRIDLSDKAAGVYMLRVVTESGVTNQQLIKE